jgi:hypothetical protein
MWLILLKIKGKDFFCYFYFKTVGFLYRTLYSAGGRLTSMSMEHWWNDTDRGKGKDSGKNYPIVTSSTTDPTRPGRQHILLPAQFEIMALLKGM